MTHEFPSYKAFTNDSDWKQETVNHSKDEYVRGNAYTNTRWKASPRW